VLRRLLLFAQRSRLRPPEAIRRLLRPLLSSSGVGGDSGSLLSPWWTPLKGDRGDPPVIETAAAPRVPGPVTDSRQSSRDRLRCLIATGALDAGGLDEVATFLALRLRSHGFETAVVHCGEDLPEDGVNGRLARVLVDGAVEVVESAAVEAAAFIRAWRPDVVSAHGVPDWVLKVCDESDIPYVETLHGMHTLIGADWEHEAKRAQGVSYYIAVSELVRQQYLSRNPRFPPERIVTIPNGVDDQRRKPVDRAHARRLLGLSDEFLFVSLARYCLQKNAFGLVRAFDDVARRHAAAHLLISGRVDDDAYYAQVSAAVERSSVKGHVHMRDHCPAPSILFAAADAFVLNSFFEGWALASMEALTFGLPVVVSEVGGAREQVGEDGSRGFLVPNPLGDPLSLDWQRMRVAAFRDQANLDYIVDAMSSVVSSREEWARRRQSLQHESVERFSAERCLLQHAEVLRQAAGRLVDARRQ
jgi:glycosyltransferase involved in cell wall biosynthesis